MSTYPTYKLGEICETTSGGTPNRKNDAYYGGSIPWVKSGELGKGVIYDTEEKITEEAVKESSAKIFPEGTLLIALYGATIGKLGFLGVPAATNQAVCGIFANEKIDLQFLSYYLFHKRNDLIAQGTGGAQPNISQTILKNLPIPLPPLPTQRAIVTRIETLFAELDKAVQRLRTAQQQLKTYKQAVLNHWLNNDEGKWEMVKLGDVIEKPTYGTSKKCDYDIVGTGVLRIPNIGNGYIIDDDLKFAVFSDEEKEKYSLKEGDLLTIRSNGSVDLVGKCALISSKEEKYLFAGYLIRLRPFPAKVNSKFLSLTLESHKLRIQIEDKAKSTSGVNNINSVEIQNLEIPLPPLAEQQRIVKEIESRLSQATASETYIENALQQAEALRQSILKKAFSGELV